MRYEIKQNENIEEQMKEVYKDPQIVNFVELAREYEYEVNTPFFGEWETMSGTKQLSLKLQVSPKEEFVPSLYLFEVDLWHGEPRVEIQTTSYGALNHKDFDKFLKAQTNALRMRDLIEAVWKSKSLPIVAKI